MTKERELLARAALVITQYSWNDDYKKETAYIRADVVDELVEALKAVVRYAGNSGDDYLADKARAALAKLEESHE